MLIFNDRNSVRMLEIFQISFFCLDTEYEKEEDNFEHDDSWNVYILLASTLGPGLAICITAYIYVWIVIDPYYPDDNLECNVVALTAFLPFSVVILFCFILHWYHVYQKVKENNKEKKKKKCDDVSKVCSVISMRKLENQKSVVEEEYSKYLSRCQSEIPRKKNESPTSRRKFERISI